MHKIAIVLAFSEYCYELCRQCVATCWRAARLSKPGGEYHFFCYECNYNPFSETRISPFNHPVDLRSDMPIDAKITQRDSSQMEWGSFLPDISVYHDFATNDLEKFDYVLFCHDDVYFNKHNTFDEIITLISDPRNDILAEVATACRSDISLRFRPSFIFVRTDKFRRCNLSFVNEQEIFDDNLKGFTIKKDGGAELFASYYSNKNTSKGIPYVHFSDTWYTHLRLSSDYGIEMSHIFSPNDPEIQELLLKSKQYTDYYLYGSNVDI